MKRFGVFAAVTLLAGAGYAVTGCETMVLPSGPAAGGAAGAGRCGQGEDCVLPPPCKDPVMYVAAAKGDDTNDGCTPDKPKKTIRAAVQKVTRSRAGATPADAGPDAAVAGRYEIKVCAGTYKEAQLVIEHPMSLRGGYDCSSFQRDPGFGYAKGFSKTNETIVENGAYSAEYNSPLNFVIRRQDTKIERDSIVDGFTFDAGAGNSGTVGITITDGASPTIQDNIIKGGSGLCSNGFGSMGIWLIAGSPLIRNNDINGGSGKCLDPALPAPGNGAGTGSYGMLLQGDGAVVVEENKISAGSGVAADAAIAVGIASAGERAIRNNYITWDAPRSEASGYNAAIGIAAVGETRLTITGNTIRGGKATCFESCLNWGILAAETASIRIEANRIYGGDAVMDPPDPATNQDRSNIFVRGIRVDHAGDALIINNMVHSGGLFSETTSPAVKVNGFYNERNATGIMCDDRGRGARIIHNTVLTVSAGPTRDNAPGAQRGGTGWDLVRPFYLAIGYENAIFEKNLALGHGVADGEFAFTLVEANGGIARAAENVFANFTGPAMIIIHAAPNPQTPPPPNNVYNTLAEAANDKKFSNTPVFERNKFIRANCAGDVDCITDALFNGKFGAVGAVLEGVTEADQGIEQLFKDGWRLRAGALPFIRSEAGAPSPLVPNDYYGKPRTNPVSFGAHESD